jgi:hypothetical protein
MLQKITILGLVLLLPILAYPYTPEENEIYTAVVLELIGTNIDKRECSITYGNSECISDALRSRLRERNVVLADCPEEIEVGRRIMLGNIFFEEEGSAILLVFLGSHGTVFEIIKEGSSWRIISSEPFQVDFMSLEVKMSRLYLGQNQSLVLTPLADARGAAQL